jgi:LPXTG-motif cell wall-anchored protein
MRKILSASLFLAALAMPGARVFAASDGQKIAIKRDLQIPGEVLKPGSYTLSVEDRMSDRAVVRISNDTDPNQHFLVLAVPSTQLSAAAGKGLILFKAADPAKQILKGWACADCPSPLELVYPKLEAAKITGDTGESVLAVDPASDKLPATLSPDDMKVVTLWLLSPERVEAGHHGAGLKAAKYQAASAGRRHLPQTASNLYWLALLGMLSLGSSLVVRAARLKRSPACTR